MVVAIGCYQPTPRTGAPCGPGDECPTGLTCLGGFCLAGEQRDAEIDAVDDAAIDAFLVDAAPDAAVINGCADFQREGFIDETMYPTIAACAATWLGAKNLRAAKTNTPCGDDLGACMAPADACSPGWHMCGLAGQPSELSNRATSAACAGLIGAFVAAMSHCTPPGSACDYTLPFQCAASTGCSEAVCCGTQCRTDAGCPTGVYAMTLIAGSTSNGCGAMDASFVSGVLCCK